MDGKDWRERLRRAAPKIHCLTNPVSMQDMANLLLAAGGSAIMAQDPEEVQEITSFCQATLLNTGVPDREKFLACTAAGMQANKLGHPVVLDPVGVGASRFRRKHMELLLNKVHPSIIRCNQEEAYTLLHMQTGVSGGVESAVSVGQREQEVTAEKLAGMYQCTAFISGEIDVISDGERLCVLSGGDRRMARLTGSGCMLSALCALFCGAGLSSYEAACAAGSIWKESSRIAGERTEKIQGGMGSFHRHLFDALDRLCNESKEETV